MEQMDQTEAKRLARAAHNLRRNEDFAEILAYIQKSSLNVLAASTEDNVERNLKIHQATVAVEQIVENLADGYTADE